MFPEIRISDSIVIPTYLPYLSFLYCFLVYYVFKRAQRLGFNTKIALDLGLILMIAGFIGGRLLHVFYEVPEYYLEDISRIFKFWEGGFVFFGGFAAGILGCLIYVKKTKISFFKWADFYAPVIALGYGLGRVGCFLSGCCYGKSCELPWGVRFSWDYHQVLRHPTQLYAVIWELGVFALLISLPAAFKSVSLQKVFQKPGTVFSLWLFLHAWGRLLMEQYRDDFRGELLLNLSISTWFSFLLLLSAIFIFTLSQKRPPTSTSH
jgi:phosphatidylglycerol:prolipoprotein diacylglycerol transferase